MLPSPCSSAGRRQKGARLNVTLASFASCQAPSASSHLFILYCHHFKILSYSSVAVLAIILELLFTVTSALLKLATRLVVLRYRALLDFDIAWDKPRTFSRITDSGE